MNDRFFPFSGTGNQLQVVIEEAEKTSGSRAFHVALWSRITTWVLGRVFKEISFKLDLYSRIMACFLRRTEMLQIGGSKMHPSKKVMYASLTENFRHAMKLKLNKLVNKSPEEESLVTAQPTKNIEQSTEIRQSFTTVAQVV